MPGTCAAAEALAAGSCCWRRPPLLPMRSATELPTGRVCCRARTMFCFSRLFSFLLLAGPALPPAPLRGLLGTLEAAEAPEVAGTPCAVSLLPRGMLYLTGSTVSQPSQRDSSRVLLSTWPSTTYTPLWLGRTSSIPRKLPPSISSSSSVALLLAGSTAAADRAAAAASGSASAGVAPGSFASPLRAAACSAPVCFCFLFLCCCFFDPFFFLGAADPRGSGAPLCPPAKVLRKASSPSSPAKTSTGTRTIVTAATTEIRRCWGCRVQCGALSCCRWYAGRQKSCWRCRIWAKRRGAEPTTRCFFFRRLVSDVRPAFNYCIYAIVCAKRRVGHTGVPRRTLTRFGSAGAQRLDKALAAAG
mmetsp:Transcript_30915/g.79403  ORF Transcript_30915/g.79403 Transcript_30915/m.79403 type:complete len:359 (-) Transcript_30915:89-1165(-)